MKILRRFLVLLALVPAFAMVPAFALANMLSITESEINQYLDTRLQEKIPLQDKVGIPGLLQVDYRLHKLATQIGQKEEKKVEINGVVDAKISVRGKEYDTKINLNFDTEPYYSPENGSLYLKNVRLLNWQVTPEKYQNELQMFMPLLSDGLATVLNNTPVYTLDESKVKEALVKKFAKGIVVEKGQLRLETSVF